MIYVICELAAKQPDPVQLKINITSYRQVPWLDLHVLSPTFWVVLTDISPFEKPLFHLTLEVHGNSISLPFAHCVLAEVGVHLANHSPTCGRNAKL